MEFDKTVSWSLNTSGDGLWSSAQKQVKIIRVWLNYVDDEDSSFGELCAQFDLKTWNVDKDGLIYTDRCWMSEFRALMKSLGFSPAAVEDISYSEQGMQGHNYVSMDVGVDFLREVEPMYRWLVNKETVNPELA